MIVKDKIYELLLKAEFISVQEVQSGICKAIKGAEKKKGLFRVMRNNQPVGVIMPDSLWQEIMRDLQKDASENPD